MDGVKALVKFTRGLKILKVIIAVQCSWIHCYLFVDIVTYS